MESKPEPKFAFVKEKESFYGQRILTHLGLSPMATQKLIIMSICEVCRDILANMEIMGAFSCRLFRALSV